MCLINSSLYAQPLLNTFFNNKFFIEIPYFSYRLTAFLLYNIFLILHMLPRLSCAPFSTTTSQFVACY